MTDETPAQFSESAAPATPPAPPAPETPLASGRTRLRGKWVGKMAVFFIAAMALALYALYDGAIAYPKRGRAAAEHAEVRYLGAARAAGRLTLAAVPDPVAERRTLLGDKPRLERERRDAQASQRGASQVRELDTQLARLAWLDALAIVGDLTPERTDIPSPSDRLALLEQVWSTREAPKPLGKYDIPFQWALLAVSAAFALYLVSLFLRVRAKVYTFDAADNRLTLPGGAAYTPDQIVEVDKRRWHKFFVTLRFEGGASCELDLYRYEPLEAWVLEMEKRAPGYEPPEAPATEAGAAAPQSGEPPSEETDANASP